MSFILVPHHGEEVQINAWNWRPTLEILRVENLVDDEALELLGCNGCGATVDDELAQRIAAALTRRLAGMRPGERVRGDLSITAEPKPRMVFKPGMAPDEIDPVELYSAQYEWLVQFRDFCERSGGFEVV
jgi:hypothetical protein